ncbi:C6 transcription factor [Aspergillus costaricaensis CBS 115574]|uniref:C6 transcription factor n=1 Tax=Aspergillus costaricaensis CBS 115574 TaxID=1448317 RepID=A0ACD1IMA9_9EURO|nr:C6 transcription factor [Aspergillus costaricaensis CBS 115574]RAK91801.1 C6 transcription factor [Aspergillus costaricaensis CBS 115574]
MDSHPLESWERPPDDDLGDRDEARPRKRRRKYIAKACNECKRRKIKCNGQSPCQRCGRQRIDCVYEAPPPRPESSAENHETLDRLLTQMTAMQEQITSLTTAVHALTQNTLVSTATALPRSDVAAQRPFRRHSSIKEKESVFQGPTTSAYSLDLAKSSLQRRGIVEEHPDVADAEDGDVDGDEGDTAPSQVIPMAVAASPPRTRHYPSGDPLWTIGKSEALRLCRVYEEEMGIMYPVLELPQLLHQVELLYGAESWPRVPVAQGNEEQLDRTAVHILRLVFACALTAEAAGSSALALSLFESVREVADNFVWGVAGIKNIIFLTLVAIFYFQIDEETLAWRTIGIVERMCLERGLHRRETLSQPSIAKAGKDRVLRLFWSIYILDIRWSFGTGMPFSLEDSDIDPWLPEPEEKTPYLRVMIRYSRIAAKVWKFISAFNNTNEIKKEEMNYLDWQVQRWKADVPPVLSIDSGNVQEEEPRSLRRLRSLLYLRANQLRMLIHRPVLHSAAHIAKYPAESQTVVELAKESIRFITNLNETTDIYRLQQVTFNWFLVSAVAVVFLAVTQAPTQFSTTCKEEFYMALELIKGFSTRSYISQRLWKSIRSLRKLGPQLMHRPVQSQPEPEWRGGAAVPAERGDLGNVVEVAPSQSTGTQEQSPLDGAQMTRELMEWFEAVGNLETQIMGMAPEGFDAGWQRYDYGEELSSVMKDCF